MSDDIKGIALRMRELREIEGISTEQLCENISVEKEQYEKYESGVCDIPVSFLYEIANYYKVSLTELLSGDAPKLHIYQRVAKGHGLKVERSKQYSYQSLAHGFVGKKAEPFLVEVEPKPDTEGIPVNTHLGQEFDYCLEGEILISINGAEMILKPGDSIYYNSNYPHGMKALGGRSAKFIAVIF